jgi:hypothetical protein
MKEVFQHIAVRIPPRRGLEGVEAVSGTAAQSVVGLVSVGALIVSLFEKVHT